MRKRRICWPNPDATCVEGGCLRCNDHPYRSLALIRRYCGEVGVLPYRSGSLEVDAIDAFWSGWSHQFWNVDVR